MRSSILMALFAAAAGDTARLTVVNGCSSGTMWIAHIATNAVGPDKQDVRISPGGSATFQTSVDGIGISASRFWPKMGCDDTGNHCAIGESGGPGEGCVIRIPGKNDNYTQCNPPVDTKFEATFSEPGSPNMDVVDMSLVDGYTLPFKLETQGGSCVRQQQPFQSMNCEALQLSNCPTNDLLNGEARDLRATNPKTGKLSGCYSPCMRLTDDKWSTAQPVAPDSKQASPYCCAGSYGNPKKCSAGPIVSTQFMTSKNQQCPYAYGYPYDDKVATIACTPTTMYTVTFYCPTDAGIEEVQV